MAGVATCNVLEAPVYGTWRAVLVDATMIRCFIVTVSQVELLDIAIYEIVVVTGGFAIYAEWRVACELACLLRGLGIVSVVVRRTKQFVIKCFVF